MSEAELKCWAIQDGIGLFSPEHGRLVGVIKQGQIFHRSQADLDVCLSWIAVSGNNMPGARFRTEAVFRDHVFEVLKQRGYRVTKEYYTSQGRIDLLAENADGRRIIEIKLPSDSHTMAHALGQLLFYSKFFPDATLWVCAPAKPDSTILSILSSFNVNFLEIDNG